MGLLARLVCAACLLLAVAAVKVKVVMHSDEADSRPEDEDARAEPWERRRDAALLPFLKRKPELRDHEREHEREHERDDEPAPAPAPAPPAPAGDKPRDRPGAHHPNEMIFPLIYKQAHINSMFKFGENWYTWSTERRTDGSKATNYYICYDEPKRCDDIGWERTEALPKCAFQIDSLLPDDRACLNAFGVEPHNTGACDGAEQMKVSEMVRACGPRIRSLWRFVRVGRRPAGAAKPADVNSLICEDEEECFITIEYRIHHDRITFSLHEPTRGQTFKSALKRETAAAAAGAGAGAAEEEGKAGRGGREGKAGARRHAPHEDEPAARADKFRARPRLKPAPAAAAAAAAAEGKGVHKERNDSGYSRRQPNKIKFREDVSEDISE